MSTQNLEQRLEQLERELDRTKSVTEIQNCMARYCYLHTGGKHKESAEMFALNTQDVSAEIANVGCFVGPEAVRKLYEKNHIDVEGDRIGFLFEHTLCGLCIEVAEDNQTAKALWVTPGHETFSDGKEAHANWIWGKYACDFIRENGQWKIWHMQMYPTFRCPYEESWVTGQNVGLSQPRTEQLDKLGSGATTDTTFCEEYLPGRKVRYWPAAPEPYASFEGTRPMVGAPPENWD